MKLLLDMGLPRSAAALLTRKGVDTIHVGDLGLSQAHDEVILQTARDRKRVMATPDADFTAIDALSSSSPPSVVRIRIEGLKGDETAAPLSPVVKRCELWTKAQWSPSSGRE
jgi:predicted nuclease of predicted toxin-antitoxin system